MNLEQTLRKSFPTGLTYNKTAQLCLSLYSASNFTPVELQSECTKENLASTFSNLAIGNFINSEPVEAAMYGANFHDIKSSGHWIEVIASIFKMSDTMDITLGHQLAARITSARN
jgi:hypothetical protein